jgi:hypothetical protein
VLTKYYAHPERYSVEDGFLRCQGLWGLKLDNNHHEYIIVFLGDLGRDLPSDEQCIGVVITFYLKERLVKLILSVAFWQNLRLLNKLTLYLRLVLSNSQRIGKQLQDGAFFSN